MKKKSIYALLLCSLAVLNGYAQKEENDNGSKKLFNKENMFTGGTLNVAFFNGTTQLGISPFFGYSINKFIDVAASMNVNYISQRDYQVYGDKLRQVIYGPGAFVRLFPVNFLFAQGQYEHNFIRYNYIPPSNTGTPNDKLHLQANSFLVGGGFAQGRGQGSNSYYYISILWDVLKDTNSPYVDNLGRALPQIRAGYNIALFQGRGRGRNRDRY